MVAANPQTASTPASGNNQFTYAQLEGIWTQAGGTNGAAPIAAAIAMAESGGNSTATHADSNGSVDRGLWQINSVHGSQSTYDVMGNARAAIAISNNGQNWTPWTTFNSGAYKQYLQANVVPDTSVPINATNAAANQAAFQLPGGLYDPANWFLDPLGSAGQAGGNAFGAVGGTLIKYFFQTLIVVMLNPMMQIIAGIMGMTAGGVMVVFGVWQVVGQTQGGQAAEGAALWGAETGISAFGPEATAATKYIGSQGTTTVTQTRKQAGRVRLGGRNFQYRPGTVKTDVQRPSKNGNGQAPQASQAPPDTKTDLRDRAKGHVQGQFNLREDRSNPRQGRFNV